MAKKETFVWLNDSAANGAVIPGKTRMPLFALVLIAPVLVALAMLTSTTIATVDAASADGVEETTFKSSCAIATAPTAAATRPLVRACTFPTSIRRKCKAIRRAIGGSDQQRQERHAAVQGQLESGSNQRLGCACAPTE